MPSIWPVRVHQISALSNGQCLTWCRHSRRCWMWMTRPTHPVWSSRKATRNIFHCYFRVPYVPNNSMTWEWSCYPRLDETLSRHFSRWFPISGMSSLSGLLSSNRLLMGHQSDLNCSHGQREETIKKKWEMRLLG